MFSVASSVRSLIKSLFVWVIPSTVMAPGVARVSEVAVRFCSSSPLRLMPSARIPPRAIPVPSESVMLMVAAVTDPSKLRSLAVMSMAFPTALSVCPDAMEKVPS